MMELNGMAVCLLPRGLHRLIYFTGSGPSKALAWLLEANGELLREQDTWFLGGFLGQFPTGGRSAHDISSLARHFLPALHAVRPN